MIPFHPSSVSRGQLRLQSAIGSAANSYLLILKHIVAFLVTALRVADGKPDVAPPPILDGNITIVCLDSKGHSGFVRRS
jgi:hypothetical protein